MASFQKKKKRQMKLESLANKSENVKRVINLCKINWQQNTLQCLALSKPCFNFIFGKDTESEKRKVLERK